jgi:hypothetical protein
MIGGKQAMTFRPKTWANVVHGAWPMAQPHAAARGRLTFATDAAKMVPIHSMNWIVSIHWRRQPWQKPWTPN